VDTCDALVVGGGPAGSSCARALTAGGLDVVVLDRAQFPRHKVCAGWVTPQVFAALGLQPQGYAEERTLQPFTGFRLGIWGGRRIEVRYRQAVSWGVLRAEFDDFLLRSSGARLRLGEPLEHLQHLGDRWVANGGISAAVVVGAGGFACPVSRLLGARGGVAVAARELEFPLGGHTTPVNAETPELWFTADLRGYGWCLRKGDYLNVGLGLEAGRDLNGQVSKFLTLIQEACPINADVQRRWDGHAYRLWGRGPARLAWDGALLVGDAAGLAYPQSGEGIRPAVESGFLAARAILAAEGDYRAERLQSYEATLRSRLGRSRSGRAPGRRPLSASRRALARLLLSFRPFLRWIVLDRWFLHRGERPLPAAGQPEGAGS
jgi:flavin-dependent dehydrogenase